MVLQYLAMMKQVGLHLQQGVGMKGKEQKLHNLPVRKVTIVKEAFTTKIFTYHTKYL